MNSPWVIKSSVPLALVLFHPPSSSFHAWSFHPFPHREQSGANCSGWSETGTDVTTCCMCLSFSWAFKKTLHILKRRRKSQWPLVLLSTDTAGAARGWKGVIFYRLATRRLLQRYTFFFFSFLFFQSSPECRCANTGSGFTTANSLISKRGNILGQICFVKVENVPHHRW